MLLALSVAACIPARTPDVLRFTPGPPVVVSDRTVTTRAFQVRYPGAWKVVLSESAAPPGVYFVAPANAAYIRVEADPPTPDGAAGEYRRQVQRLTLADGRALTVTLAAPADSWAWALYQPAWARVLDSLAPPPQP